MSIAYDFEGANPTSEMVAFYTNVDFQPWGARLRDPEVPVALLLKGVALHIGSFALLCMAVLQWTMTDIEWNAEIALIKLALTAIAMAGALMFWTGAKQARPVMFDIDTDARELRTVLANSTETILNRTGFDDLEEVYVATSDEFYVLAYHRHGDKSAEVLARGSLASMQRFETMISRAVA